MALTDFFRINMPYGIIKNKKGEWLAFNREYVPIGWNSHYPGLHIADEDSYSNLPIRTKYKNATDVILKQLIDETSSVEYDENGKINKIFLYNDETNPTNNEKYWNSYLEKIRILSQLKTHF
jgi:hypothetical protein